jgi:DNA-binding XRE family transcriptional regulator
MRRQSRQSTTKTTKFSQRAIKAWVTRRRKAQQAKFSRRAIQAWHTRRRKAQTGGVEIVSAAITANHIKHVLAAKNLTQEELSRRVGVSYRHINRLVLGKSEPGYLLVQRIAVVLNEPAANLFSVTIVTRPRP